MYVGYVCLGEMKEHLQLEDGKQITSTFRFPMHSPIVDGILFDFYVIQFKSFNDSNSTQTMNYSSFQAIIYSIYLFLRNFFFVFVFLNHKCLPIAFRSRSGGIQHFYAIPCRTVKRIMMLFRVCHMTDPETISKQQCV